jgi:hypothetical protein
MFTKGSQSLAFGCQNFKFSTTWFPISKLKLNLLKKKLFFMAIPGPLTNKALVKALAWPTNKQGPC